MPSMNSTDVRLSLTRHACGLFGHAVPCVTRSPALGAVGTGRGSDGQGKVEISKWQVAGIRPVAEPCLSVAVKDFVSELQYF